MALTTFTGLADGTYYVVIDSKSLGAANVWAEQTYGVAGAAQGAAFTLLGGALYGGRERTGAGTSDNAITLTGAEHVTRVSVAGGNVANVDSGFSFNAIVNARGDAIDDDIASARLQQGTFRQFILNSNAIVGVQTANFSIGGGGPQSISITAALPAITDAVILDATSQEGFSGTPIIELNGLGSGGGVDALTINSGGSTVRGFVINRFGRDGIVLTGGGGNTIAGNYIGTNAGGTADAGNARYGIRVASGNNLVGGTAGADRNVISGNNLDGIYVVGSSGNFIRGNYIGTDRTGMIAVGNSEDGIWLDNASNTTVGGSVSGAGNLISGNGWSGVAFLSGGSGNIVQGNLIGVNAAGTGPLSNGHHGIDIAGSSGTTVGGLAAGQANVIAHNTWDGVSITSGTGHTISGNSIHSNGGLGIDIGNDAVTPNDLLPGDLDGGANNQQNFPVLTSATVNGGQISITGTLSSSLTGSFRIEFFASSAADPSAHGEGQRYLGSSTVSTLLGNATINATLLSAVTPGEFVSATATNLATGDTSEFASSISATGNTAPVVSLPVSPTVPEDAPLAFTGANQITVADGENNLAQVTLTVLNGTLTAAAAGGAVVSGSGTSLVTINGIQSAIAATLASVSYQGALNYSGPEQLTVTATDAGGLQDTESVAVTVTPVNDAPAGTDATVTTNEDVAHVFTVANFGFTDVDALDTMSAVRIDALPAAGTLTLNAVALTAGQVILVADINAGLLRFNPAPDASGVPYTTFTFSVRDSGGPAFDPAPNSLTINVTAVNDTPVANNASASGNEDDPQIAITLTGTDVEGRSRASALPGLPANGVLYIDPGLTTLAAVATDYAAAGNARTFYFVPAGNWNGTTTFQFTANDAGGLSDPTPANATINVLPVNDAPVANNASTSGNEDDAQIAITLTGADTEGPIASFRLIGLPVNGVLYIDPGLTSLAAVATDYAATGNARTFYFVPAGNWNGTTGFQFTAVDGGGLTDATPANAAITVTPVNDVPAAVADAAATNENTPVTTGDVLANDSLGDTPTTITAFDALSAQGGTVVLNAGNTFTYTPAASFSGTDTFTYTIQDADGDSATGTVTVTVANVANDAPVNRVPGAQISAEDVALVFSTGNGNAISVSDPDAGASPLQVTLTANQGTLTLAGTAGLTFIVGGGTGDATMTFSGTQAAINAALDGMSLLPPLNYTGPASVTITTDDMGATGGGGPLSDTDTVDVTVNVVNDAPTLDLDANDSSGAVGANYVRTFTEGLGSVRITDVDAALGDIDSPSLASLTVTITNFLDGVNEVLTANTGATAITATYAGRSAHPERRRHARELPDGAAHDPLREPRGRAQPCRTDDHFRRERRRQREQRRHRDGNDRCGQRRPERRHRAGRATLRPRTSRSRSTAPGSRSPTSTRCRARSSPSSSDRSRA